MLDIAVAGSVATVTLDRPELHNAFDDRLIVALTDQLTRLGDDDAVRAIVLTGRGPSFSAGADLAWMRRMADYSTAENVDDARKLAALMQVLDGSRKPTVARVNGSAFAGALGLIACCDIAIAVSTAQFGVTEVRLGLIPAVIGPYLVRCLGARQARRLFLTAERFGAAEAQALGLVHEVVEPDALDAAVERSLAMLAKGSPAAIASAKALVQAVDRPIDAAVIDDTARRIAAARASPDGREGVAAFLEKRAPDWGRP